MASRGGDSEPLYDYELEIGTLRQMFACEDSCLGDDEPFDCGLWIGDVASGEVTQVTSNTSPPCDRENNLRWSPDGRQLVYLRDPYENGKPVGTAVYVINADGSEERRLTDPADFVGEADWSPDGEWIVYATYPLREFNYSSPITSNLFRIHLGGTRLQQLTFNQSVYQRAVQPRYIPEAQYMAR